MRRRVLLIVLALTIFSTGTASAQQAGAPLQQSAPSPQLPPGKADVARTMNALQEKILSTGRKDYAVVYKSGTREVSRSPRWEQVTSVVADPKSCSLRTMWQSDRGPFAHSFYLDEISGATTQPLALNWPTLQEVQGGPFLPANIEPALYSVVVKSWMRFIVVAEFATKDEAEQTADLLSESIKLCSGIPIALPQTATGSPSLVETLAFIADKLSTQGPVIGSAYVGTANGAPNWNVSLDYAGAAMNSTACTLSATDLRLSFRHIGKIEVLKFKDYVQRAITGTGLEGLKITNASPIFVLYITAPGGESKELYFSDETLANRVAKAMVHAAEICGAGANKEPF